MNDKFQLILSLFEEGVLIIAMIISNISIVKILNITILKTNDEIYSFFDLSSEGNPISLGTWPGTKSGSHSRLTLITSTSPCFSVDKNCVNVKSTPSVPITKWKGKQFTVHSSYSYDDLYAKTVPYGSSCPSGKKQCGILDTMNNTLCMEDYEECPINLMIFSNSPTKPEKYDYDFKTVLYNNTINNVYLHYTNQAVDRYIITSKWTVSDDDVCIHPNDYNSHYKNCILDNYHYTCRSVYGVETNHFYQKIDTYDKYNLYEENGIIDELNKAEWYPISNFNFQRTSLYFCPFIGYDRQCHEKTQKGFIHLIFNNHW